MELWGWLIGYVVLFALLHLVLYYLYARRESDDGAPTHPLGDANRAGVRPRRADGLLDSSDDPDGARIDADRDALAFDGEPVTCPHCGAANEGDSTFTYCWNCTSTLRG